MTFMNAPGQFLPGVPAPSKNVRGSGFSLTDLLAVLASLAAFGLLTLPFLGATRGDSQRVSCFNNQRRLGIAAAEYVDEHGGEYPRRMLPAWPEQLRSYYGPSSVLICPADAARPLSFGTGTNADARPRSYIMNGWSDFYLGHSLAVPFPSSAIREPAGTVVFGEKDTLSGHFWMDFAMGEDYTALEQARHRRNPAAAAASLSGGSNYSFADGSVRFLRWGESLFPVNLWMITPEFRRVRAE